MIHTGNFPFKCSFDGCNTGCATKCDLDKHMKRHLGVKQHRCDVCKMAFVTKHELNKHSLTHTNEFSFRCKHPKCGCDKGFRRKRQLEVHIMRVLGIKEYACIQCEMRFVTFGELKQH